jgi:hypothetical protein
MLLFFLFIIEIWKLHHQNPIIFFLLHLAEIVLFSSFIAKKKSIHQTQILK